MIWESCSEKIFLDFHAYCSRLAANKCRLVEHIHALGAIGFPQELSNLISTGKLRLLALSACCSCSA
ncbi:hypothetical protein [Sideroxydans sp. CL21]|nr:hypothetical protein [Sideroxydans sp. CL21]